MIIIITETLIVKMLLYGHSIAGEKVGCKGQELWSGESTTTCLRNMKTNGELWLAQTLLREVIPWQVCGVFIMLILLYSFGWWFHKRFIIEQYRLVSMSRGVCCVAVVRTLIHIKLVIYIFKAKRIWLRSIALVASECHKLVPLNVYRSGFNEQSI